MPGDANDNYLVGGGIVVVAMYRCVSRAVPPWAVEYVPSVLKSLYSCCGNDPEVFHTILVVGSELQLNGDYNSGCVRIRLLVIIINTIQSKRRQKMTFEPKLEKYLHRLASFSLSFSFSSLLASSLSS